MNNPFAAFANAVTLPESFTPSKTAHPVFVGGIKYPSLFDANFDSGISSVSIWKALKRHGGGPVQIRKTLVVMECWVITRTNNIKGSYQL